ncbi:MAG: ribonuclease catalytic domain-containing protein [Treponema sp.]|nr:ribonuclease catalytic domain-containing protein [Treponema sp.]
MIPLHSLVLYKTKPALVSGFDDDKILITLPQGESLKVREKDIELLHGGPASLSELEGDPPPGDPREAWELLLDEGEAPAINLGDLAELIYGTGGARNVWAAYQVLKEGHYFSGSPEAIRPRTRAQVEEEEKRREERQKESGDREAFLGWLKKLPPFKFPPLDGEEAPKEGSKELPPGNERFLQDVEALARGLSDKSRTLKDLGKSESPEEAHRLLLASGAWTVWENPYPGRYGIEKGSAAAPVPPPPEEERLDLGSLEAYAIDNAWSNDPDDAVSLEGPGLGAQGPWILWVHVADPAASILPGSPSDQEARNRGASLYLPEGTSRMLEEGALPLYALGGGEKRKALSFKMKLKNDLSIESTEIIPSLVKVTSLSYQEADVLIDQGSPVLSKLMELAEANMERRLEGGAVLIELPEVHIHCSPHTKEIKVDPIPHYRSAELVRECMIWAGEGAAAWALQQQLAFPFISQEAGELPEERLGGLAGAFQIRRSMRARSLSAKPGVHWGLGLDAYTQVTSPLRRYTDLLCHQQIRARLGQGAYRDIKPLDEEEVLLRAAAAEAAAAARVRCERASRTHWMGVYLAQSAGSEQSYPGIILDKRGPRGTVMIPPLGLETQVSLRGGGEPNQELSLKLGAIRIPEGEISFIPLE